MLISGHESGLGQFYTTLFFFKALTNQVDCLGFDIFRKRSWISHCGIQCGIQSGIQCGINCDIQCGIRCGIKWRARHAEVIV